MDELFKGNENKLSKIVLIGENKDVLIALFNILHNHFLVDCITNTSDLNNDSISDYDLVIISFELLKDSYIKNLIKGKLFITYLENFDLEKIDYALSLNTKDVLIMPFNQSLILNRVNNVLSLHEIKTIYLPKIEELNSQLSLEINQNKLLAEISNEIQFRYIYETNTLKVSSLGEKILDIKEGIVNPKDNEKLLSIFSHETYFNLINLIKNTSIEKPSISIETKVSVNNKYH